MPEDINMKIIMSVTNCFRNLFSVLKKFFEKMESKDNTYIYEN